jgi:hypothetical protein
MTDFQPRTLTTFESTDGLTVATFGRAEYEWDSEQPLATPFVDVVGSDYGFDQLGTAPAKKMPGTETLRYMVFEDDPADVDAAVDDIMAKCFNIGLGKLWATDKTGARRWAYARATKLPSLKWSAGDIFSRSVEMEFRRQSDWYEASLSSISETIDSVPETFTLTNPGALRLFNAILLLSGTWHGPISITNETNGYLFSYAPDGDDSGSSINDHVMFDSGAGRCWRSTDAGLTWSAADDKLQIGGVLASSQVQIMRLDAGDNDFSVTDGGTPNATLTFEFYPANA